MPHTKSSFSKDDPPGRYNRPDFQAAFVPHLFRNAMRPQKESHPASSQDNRCQKADAPRFFSRLLHDVPQSDIAQPCRHHAGVPSDRCALSTQATPPTPSRIHFLPEAVPFLLHLPTECVLPKTGSRRSGRHPDYVKMHACSRSCLLPAFQFPAAASGIPDARANAQHKPFYP